jgi:transposase-like protein
MARLPRINAQAKYLNNIIEQDHRFIKKITKPMMGFKAFHSAQATIAGIETALGKCSCYGNLR